MVISAVLVSLIISISYLLYTNGPRVRLVQIDDAITQSTLTRGSSITLTFDRPLDKRDYTDAISLQPETNFTASVGTQAITLLIEENLTSNRAYTLRVAPEIYDRSGKKMRSNYTHTFKTAAPSYAYIERNYGPNEDPLKFDTTANVDDYIKLVSLGSTPEIVFAHPQIRLLAASKDFLVTAVKEEEFDRLFVIDIATRDHKEIELLFRGRINNLALSERGQVALIEVQPDFNSVSEEYFNTYANRVEAIDLVSGDTWQLTDSSGTLLKAFELSIDTDGQVALIQDQDLTYYAVSPFNDYDPVLIGTYTSSFGFTNGASEILFSNYDDLVRYDVGAGESQPVGIDTDFDGYVQALSNKSGRLYASAITYVAGRPRSQVNAYNEQGESKTVWETAQADTDMLRDFSESYDGTVLSLQLNPEFCQYDSLGIGSQCKTTRIQVYDVDKQATIDEFTGSSLVWIP